MVFDEFLRNITIHLSHGTAAQHLRGGLNVTGAGAKGHHWPTACLFKDIGNLVSSDKTLKHGYFDFYCDIMRPLRRSTTHITGLEVGFG
jgi:hypothetical protein